MSTQGLQTDPALTAAYQASLARTMAQKAKLDEMARSGKYDTREYEKALAEMALMTQFQYQAQAAR